ncbi:MAG: LysR substrate-binding domain-containing protein [Rubricella sp.]
MSSITLRNLRYVEALARTGHFGRAADLCSVSQPALSMQIRELEASLGQPLFYRSTRMVRPTGFGDRFILRAREILRAVDELDDLARASTEAFSGRLGLGIIPTVGPYLLPRIIERLNARFPQADLHVRETVTPRLIEEIENGTIDAAIVALPVSEASFVEVPLFSERFVFVRPRGEEDRPAPRPDALREMRLLLLEEGHCFRDQALSFCKLEGRAPRELLDGSSLSTLVQMVGAGIGVTLIPEMAVPIETRSAEVSTTRFPEPEPSRTIGLVWRRSTPLDGHLRQIAELLEDLGTAAGHGQEH